MGMNRRFPIWGWPALAAAFAYSNAATCGFALDDGSLIVGNKSLDDLGQLVRSLAHPQAKTTGAVLYRPLGIGLFALDRALFGPWAGGYHWVSALLHIVATGLVVAFVSRLGARSVAVAAGLLFAVHPIHTEAVTGIANRSEVLATIFQGERTYASIGHRRGRDDGTGGQTSVVPPPLGRTRSAHLSSA